MSPREIVDPVVTKRPDAGDSVQTHPSYANIAASRVSGHANLYGSDLQHQHYVVVRIGPSELHRSLSSDNYYGRNRQLIEVAMTEAQWATFVSSTNAGNGVPCTLQFVAPNPEHTGLIPGLPDAPSRVEQFEMEVRQTVQDAIDKLKGLVPTIEASSLPKKAKSEIIAELNRAVTELVCNLPFVAGQFVEHAENVVARSKIEVEAHLTHALLRIGASVSNRQEPAGFIDVPRPASEADE